MVTTRVTGIALVAAGVVVALSAIDGPVVLLLVAAALVLYGVRLITSKPSNPRKHRNDEIEVEIEDDDIRFKKPPLPSSRPGSRHGPDNAQSDHSDHSDWDGGND